jgi:hypothetical protein
MSKARQGRKSTKKARREVKSAPPAPMDMSQYEVEAMALGGPVAKAVAKRLRAQPAPKISPKASSNQNQAKLAPAPISRAEMADLRKSGVLPSKTRERIMKDSSQGYPAATRKKTNKAEPSEPPPSKRTR